MDHEKTLAATDVMTFVNCIAYASHVCPNCEVDLYQASPPALPCSRWMGKGITRLLCCSSTPGFVRAPLIEPIHVSEANRQALCREKWRLTSRLKNMKTMARSSRDTLHILLHGMRIISSILKSVVSTRVTGITTSTEIHMWGFRGTFLMFSI